MQQQQAQQQGLARQWQPLRIRARENPTLVDTKGLGKPPPLKNTESEFLSWARRTENFVVSVHPGARDVLTWAVERESATVTEANAATEVLMPLGTLRSVVHSADDPSGESRSTSLWALDREKGWKPGGVCTNDGTPDDGKSKRIAQRDPFSCTCQVGRAARRSGTVGGLDEVVHAKKRCPECSASHASRGHQNGGVEALLPEKLERRCQLQRTRLDTNQKLREEVVLHAEARGYAAPKLGRVSKGREDRDDPIDVGGFGQCNGRTGNGKRWCEVIRTSERAEDSRSVLELREKTHQSKDCWTRPQHQQNQGQSNSPGQGNDVKGKSGNSGGKKGKSKDAGALVCIVEVQLRAR